MITQEQYEIKTATPPSICPKCDSVREWSPDKTVDSFPIADCYSCGNSFVVKG